VTRYHLAFVLACSFSAVLLGSCSKIDTTDLGNELIPAADNVNTFETVLDVITDNQLFSDTTRMLDDEAHAIGIIDNDPEFGKTEAFTYASFTPQAYRAYPFVKRDSVIIDSVVLSLAYAGVYGDSSSVQEFEVKEIDNRFVPFTDSLYYLTAPEFPVADDVIGTATVNFLTLNDSVKYKNSDESVATVNELRIKLDTSWARRFVNYDTTTAYRDDTVFKKNFGGLRIKATETSPTKNAIAYFDLSDDDRTRITFYCRIQNNGKADTISPYFSHTNDPHANIIRRDPQNDYLANVTNNVPNDEKLYIQSTPGSYATIKIPGLDTLNNRVIHRAELILEKYPGNDGFYSPPALMFIDAISSTGDSAFTIRNDFIPVNAAPGYDLTALGGTLKNDQYVFNLSRYVQSIVTKKFPSYTLKVYAPFTTQPNFIPEYTDKPSGKLGVIVNTPVASGRVVLYGGGSTDPKRVRLRIIYSKI
jgi:hypothetical protein